jgi:two-component system, response regulator / RNA-binding antiterminator
LIGFGSGAGFYLLGALHRSPVFRAVVRASANKLSNDDESLSLCPRGHCGLAAVEEYPLKASRDAMTRLSIIVVEKDRDRALRIVDGLMASGDHSVTVIAEGTGLARKIAEQRPDIVLIDAGDPSRDVLEELALVSGPMERPVAMFVDRSDEQMTRAAIEAGVSAYVVDGLHPDRIKPILDAAIARFHLFQKMRAELAATKAALEERKIIDRAKAILMKARGIDEEAAYALLRKTAMDQNRRMADIAQQLVMAAGLLT